ncbi:MAG: PAS domain-containing protein [Chitinophagaceae bacterium]|nr:MAG: PAS domain-containing protein [Chitinophagaceae bacterium]
MEELSLLTTALNSTTAGITITDNTQPDNPIIFCNDSFEMITGYKRQEIIGRNCRFLQGTDRAQPELDKLREHINSGKACRVELRNYKKDGHLFYNELYLSPVKDAKGNIRFFIGIQNDVTARKNAEETLVNEREAMAREVAETTQRLRENEQYLASIIETVRESLIVLSPDLIVLSVNHHFLRVFQVTLEETKGRSLFELGNGQWNSEQLRVLLDQVLPTSNPVLDFEVEHDFPTIGKKLMLLNAYRVELEGKYKDRILLAIEDITERRAMEMRKDDFLSIASHELKTPLTTIKGYIQVASTLVKADTNPRLVNILAKTEKSAERLNNLISELLDMARIQSGSVKLLMEEYDFDLLVRETIFEFGDTVPDRIIKLEGSTDVKLLLDEGHLVQVIVNLLSNAIKYSDNSSEVNVYIGRVGDYVKLSVTDKGVGISEDEKKHVFDRFFRSQHIQMKYPGMGIGLYICDQIIKNHNGSLWVESTHGEGSTFSFTIPVNQSL